MTKDKITKRVTEQRCCPRIEPQLVVQQRTLRSSKCYRRKIRRKGFKDGGAIDRDR